MANAHNLPHKESTKIQAFLTIEIPVIHQMTGINAYISQMGFVTSQFRFDFSEYVPLLMTCVQLIAAILSMLYILKLTPRKILLIGNLGMSLCCFIIGICFMVIHERFEAFWSIIAFLVVFMALNGGTFIPAIGLYVADIGSRRTIRWSLFMNWFICAWSVVIFIMIGDRFGYATVFLVFGSISMIGFVLNVFFMIETKFK
jgi:MFS family permease